MGFLRTVIILIFIWYVFTLLARFVFPIVLRFLFNKAAQKANESYQNISTNRKKEGEVTITHKPEVSRNSNTDGEYIDYEEVNN